LSTKEAPHWYLRCVALKHLALSLFGAQIYASDETAIHRFPVLTDGVVKFDPKSEADRDSLRAIVGDKQYQTVMREAAVRKGTPIVLTTKQAVGESSANQVAVVVKDMREQLCQALGKGDEFKFTMAWDASAKVWGIGVSGNSGIEVIIKCEKK